MIKGEAEELGSGPPHTLVSFPRSWAHHTISLGLSFLVCDMGTMVATSGGCQEG